MKVLFLPAAEAEHLAQVAFYESKQAGLGARYLAEVSAALRKALMTSHASGTFEVKITPQAAEENVGDPTVGRMSLDKEFRGDLQAVSKGQMLAVRTGIEGSAGYVAIERVIGSLGGRKGTFSLQHSGVMRRGAPALMVTVIPDSGTDELTGLDGTMAIIIADGKHMYEFDYSIGDPTKS